MIIGISLDEDIEKAREYIRKHDIQWPQIFDGGGFEGRLTRLYKIWGIPCEVVVDKKGKVRYPFNSEDYEALLSED